MTYLSKDGKVDGPFDANQLLKMKESGDFYKYEWMWDGVAPDWSPVPRRLKTPPPLPEGSTPPGAEVQHANDRRTSSRPKTPAEPLASNKVFPAVIFDNRQSIGGEISHATARGAKFVSTSNANSHFPKGASVFIDVLDEGKDKSSKVKGTIAIISRMDNRWVFELEWSGLPIL